MCGDALGLCPLPLKPNGCGITGLAVHGVRSWRHVGMPPYGVRRGYGGKRRSVRADIQSAPTGAPAVGFYCRGALHMRPCRAAGTAGLAVHGARSWRHVGIPPYGVRRGRGGNRGSVRADIQSAPTGAPAVGFYCRGALHMRPCRAAGTAGLAVHGVRSWRHVGMPPYGVRRGYGGKRRSVRADIQSAPTGAPAVGFYCRGALHMRPCRAAGTAGLAVHGARSWRHVGMPPYGVRRGYGGKRRSVRADIQSAPTGAPAVGFYCRGALHMRPCRAAGTAGLAVHGARSWRHVGMPPYGVRRGYGGKRRSVRADIQSAPTGAPAVGFCCRGALHMRPCRAAGTAGLAVHGARSWRHVGMPPYGVRRGYGGKRRSVRADIQSAPTGAPAVGFYCRGALHMRPCRAAGTAGLAVHGARSWRHVGIPPYGVRRGAAGSSENAAAHGREAAFQRGFVQSGLIRAADAYG